MPAPAVLKSTLAWGNLLLKPDERAPAPKTTPIDAATAKQLIQNQLAARNPEHPEPATPVPVAKTDPAVLPTSAVALADTSIKEPILLPSSAAIENNLQILKAEADADLMTGGEGEDQDDISAKNLKTQQFLPHHWGQLPTTTDLQARNPHWTAWLTLLMPTFRQK